MASSVGSATTGDVMGSDGQTAVSFAEALKKAGKELHDKAEGTPVVKAIFDGTITESEYMDYLACLFEVYDQLEKELELLPVDSSIAPLVIPEFYRASSIKSDLKAFGDEERKPNAKAEEYRAHLKSIGQYHPHRLVAHAYLRYLGDLFGGMMIHKKLGDRFPGKLNFYDFKALCEAKQLKSPAMFARKFKEILNTLPLTPLQQNEVVDEVLQGYQMHYDMFIQIKS